MCHETLRKVDATSQTDEHLPEPQVYITYFKIYLITRFCSHCVVMSVDLFLKWLVDVNIEIMNVLMLEIN